ncbi:FAD-dependent monooxygenase [Nonomuraea sp. NPDC050783]|uniref:FAD-dependent monooxygenase n=1 Tax=Nonomuraea sp. NPDC050783 TaxID=3154634 RepID=UPI003465E431
MHDEHVPVLISGGSLVGLSAAVFLAWHGVRPLLVERHPDTSIYARAWGVNPRTMELYRSVGLEPAIRRAQRRLEGKDRASGILRAESLAGEEHEWFEVPYLHGVFEDSSPVSPTGWAPCPQDRLEPLLRARAVELGADVRFGVRLAEFEQDGEGVTAVLEDRSTGGRRTVRAGYLLACDGNASPVRRRLGIPTDGLGTMVHNMAILFEADLTEAVRGRAFMHCQVMNEDVMGVLGTDGERWQLDAMYFPGAGAEEEFGEERCVRLVRAATGLPELEVRILGRLPWELAARVAARVRAGRVFLAGDAARVHPPTGGFGANTGVQDAHNLAWKLAYVLSGRAGAALLDTYEDERLPVGRFTVDQAVARSLDRFKNPAVGDVAAVPIVDDLTVMMGYRYRSSATVPEAGDPAGPAPGPGAPGPGDHDPSDYDPADYDDVNAPSGRPGTRAPHVPLDTGGSTIDLLGRDFTLLAGADGAGWARAAAGAARARGVPLDAHLIADEPWAKAYGVGSGGAVLVRPDGFIAWRAGGGPAPGTDRQDTLGRVLDRVLSRTQEEAR